MRLEDGPVIRLVLFIQFLVRSFFGGLVLLAIIIALLEHYTGINIVGP